MEDQGGKNRNSLDRRAFIGSAALAAAALTACGGGGESRPLGNRQQRGPDQAPEGAPLKAGLVGCGGRGTGAALNFLEAGPHLEVTVLGDVFEDRLEKCRQSLKEGKGVEIADANAFVGFDAFEKVIASDVDIVMLATPPHFRPQHFRAAVDARKHVFMEKPVAVDPVGIRSILQSAERADAFRLKVVTGTQRRHQPGYIETYNRIMDGAIGEIVAARCYWNQSQLWFEERQEGWSDMEAMIRDWVNWNCLSGDHIVEQHVHNLDVINWFTNSHPVRALGCGGRARRVSGDQYDYFSVDYELENGMHVASMCRQVDGCTNQVAECIIGTKGASNCADTIYAPDGSEVWHYEEPQGERSPYVLEQVDLVTAIRLDQPINEARNTAISTMVAIMGRISAYTGLETTWDEMMASDLRLGPTEYAMGPVEMRADIPRPGRSESSEA